MKFPGEKGSLSWKDIATRLRLRSDRAGASVVDSRREVQSQLISIREDANRIATNVRNYGETPYGQMWAQAYSLLPDGRVVFLQQSQSQDESHSSEVLEINIQPGDNGPSVHIRYDLARSEIYAYEVRRSDGDLITMYKVEGQPENGTRFPPHITLEDIVPWVRTDLQKVLNASLTLSPAVPE